MRSLLSLRGGGCGTSSLKAGGPERIDLPQLDEGTPKGVSWKCTTVGRLLPDGRHELHVDNSDEVIIAHLKRMSALGEGFQQYDADKDQDEVDAEEEGRLPARWCHTGLGSDMVRFASSSFPQRLVSQWQS